MSILGKPTIYEIPSEATLRAPLAGLPGLLQNKYDFNSHIFPNDLGTSENGHYAVFNINVPTNILGNDRGGFAGRFTAGFEAATPTDMSKVDQLRFAPTPSGIGGKKPAAAPSTASSWLSWTKFLTLPGASAEILRRAFSGSVTDFAAWLGSFSPLQPGGENQVLLAIPRQTKRITASIALHMPTPLVFNTHNVYEEISLTSLAGKGLGILSIFGPAGKRAGELLQSVGSVGAVGAKLAQRPINPMVEILFSTVAPRQFTFEVLMAPRNEKESESIKNIVKAFRFHGAPEVGGLGGLQWIPPADFDITFFNKGIENVNILRINTCVLERIEVDYAPTSGVYSTFRNGHPVAVRMSLGFRELEPISKERILQGF